MNSDRTMTQAAGLNEATFQSLLEDVGRDQLPLVLKLFGDELVRRTGDLEAARAASDVEGLRRAAHGVKGSASTFGATRVAAAARRLEEGCRAAQPAPELAKACDALLEDMAEATTSVRRWLAAEENGT